jgi:hypothetical protein
MDLALALVTPADDRQWGDSQTSSEPELTQTARQAGYSIDLDTISTATATQQRTGADKRLALEQHPYLSEQPHHETLTLKKVRLACAIALPLLIFGCQCHSTSRILSVPAQCQPLLQHGSCRNAYPT